MIKLGKRVVTIGKFNPISYHEWELDSGWPFCGSACRDIAPA